jgi:cytochrome c oxidase subunit 2
VGKGWAWFFGVVLMATFLIWFVSPFYGWWLPENVSSYGREIDNLFYIILGLTGFFFVLTEVVMVYAMARFSYRPGEKSTYTHGSHRLELLWTAVPAAILLFIAFTQIRAWEGIKYRSRMPNPDLTLTVTARQWEWRMRYSAQPDAFRYDEADLKDRVAKERQARAWAESPQIDDVHLTNEIHCWRGANVKVWLRTVDVLHSLTIPNLRIKQDTLPGKTIPMWFKATKSNTRFLVTNPQTGEGRLEEPADKTMAWEIACQELCGGRHYAMRGRLYVHESRESYEAWLRWATRQQQLREPEKALAAGS